MGIFKPAYGALAVVLVLCATALFWDTPVYYLEELVGENRALGACVLGVAMFVATVVAPIAVLPAVPLVAPVLGPFVTGTVSLISWTLGSVVAFLIARHAGRPLLSKFVSLKEIERYEAYIPKDTRFFTVVILRMIVPADILSYALGLLSTISLRQYTLATVIGIAWFSYSLAYLGFTAAAENKSTFFTLAVGSIAFMSVLWLYVILKVRKNSNKD